VVREELAGAYGEEWGALTRLCGALRERIQAAGGEKIRREIVRRLAHDSQLRAILKEGRDDDALAHAVQCLSSWSE
jgi:hypothetical protein